MTVGMPSSSSTASRRRRTLVGALILAGALLGLNVQSASASAQSASVNVGGGTADVLFDYTNPGGVPPVFANCKPTTFDVRDNSSATVVVNLQTTVDPDNPIPGSGAGNTGFAGTVLIKGTGEGDCESTTIGFGGLSLTVPQKQDPLNESTFACDDTDLIDDGSTTLVGTFIREATDFQAILTGTCAVNKSAVEVAFILRGEWLPQPLGGSGLAQPGISVPTTEARFRGAIVVLPL